MTNRLASSTSPYLRQHADNPVDWQEWGPEPFAEARRRDVPILLSVGYSACHWCHVMAHDSFEDSGIAAILNEGFVSIKVDREERPDIDAVYMDAVTALTGQGGWPMTCVLTPDGKPFYAGTFFPRDHFGKLLSAISDTWTQQREEVLAAGQRVVEAINAAATAGEAAPVGPAELDEAARVLGAGFDRRNGGFGSAPKFPPSMVLEFLLRHHERGGDPASLDMVTRTCEAMARGGMYDQLGGGFARYAVDAGWVVPHFEKMLYDNALLLRVYLHWWRVSGDPLAERIARETADFLLRELATGEGGFASALDADTDGVEGLTYVWTPAQLEQVLGRADAEFAARLFGVTADGTFEHGASTLQLRRDPAAGDDAARWRDIRARLLASRSTRPQPGRDDKVVTAWNGLTISGLVEAGMLLGVQSYLDAAVGSANLLLSLHVVDGRLRRTSRAGRVGAAAGVADDYGNLAEGLLLLHQATGEPGWLSAAGRLLDIVASRFADQDGGFFDTADDAEELVRRPHDPTDNATPSGQSAIVAALIGYSALTGSPAHRAAAERALAGVAGLASAQPRFLGWALASAEALACGPVEVAVVGEPGRGPLTETAWFARPPGAVIVSGLPGAAGVPLLAGRPLVNGTSAAYVCRGMVCERPVTSVADLAAALTSGASL
ncbi:MAG TPA: thioredoxin domain-containing protein [Jatrophihabitantaceae bacterium]|nr:thioredoxin domain-containing protein [Jatrophihabitantaceae bacterium]